MPRSTLVREALAGEDLPFAANLSMLFTERPLLERPVAAAVCGFDAVECWWPFAGAAPGAAEVDAFVAAVRAAGVELVALNCYAGDMAAGERGVVSLPDRTEAFCASVEVLVRVAARTGCRRFNALYGQRVPGAGDQDAVATENLVYAARAVAPLGGVVLVEPLTAGENGDYPLHTAADVMAVVERVRGVGAPNVALLADVYHLTRNGDDPLDVVVRYGRDVGHVQIADAPGRHEPGTGQIDFAGLFELLARTRYPGFIGLEYRPSGTTEASLAWLPVDRRRRAGGAERAAGSSRQGGGS